MLNFFRNVPDDRGKRDGRALPAELRAHGPTHFAVPRTFPRKSHRKHFRREKAQKSRHLLLSGRYVHQHHRKKPE